MRLRRQLLRCRSLRTAMLIAWRLLLQVEGTARGRRCEFCQLDHRPAPPCIALE